MARRDMRRTGLNIAFGSIVVVMTVISCAVVIRGAEDEPYDTFRYSDAFTQVVIGTVLISFWICSSLVAVALVSVGQLSRIWLIVLLWAAICIFYLKDCPLGYLHDLEQFIIPYAGSTTGQ
jgi:hypothetical protein